MKASAKKKKKWPDPKRLASVTPSEILPQLRAVVESRLDYESDARALEDLLGDSLDDRADLEIFDLGATDKVTLEDAARFLEIVRRDREKP